MTVTALHLTDDGEAADLAAFLARLIHYDRAAAVRLQVSGTALAVFGLLAVVRGPRDPYGAARQAVRERSRRHPRRDGLRR